MSKSILQKVFPILSFFRNRENQFEKMDQQFNDMMKNMKITPDEVDRMTKGKSSTLKAFKFTFTS